jgi:hypothetical protein
MFSQPILIMDAKEHIHFITSGEHIHETYPLVVKGKDITRTYVIVERNIGTISPKQDVDPRDLNKKIQAAIEKVKTKSDEMDIAFELIQIESVTLESIRDAILEVYNKYPDARFSFNITGGTKLHSIGLFVMSVWLMGDVYYTPTKNSILKLAIPKMQIKELSGNPNYIEILKSLSPSPRAKDKNIARKVTRKDLFSEMKKRYKPVRDIGDRKTKRDLGSGTLTKLLANMLDWELIVEEFRPGSKKEKIYSIAPDGEFAVKFFLIQQKKAGRV